MAQMELSEEGTYRSCKATTLKWLVLGLGIATGKKKKPELLAVLHGQIGPNVRFPDEAALLEWAAARRPGPVSAAPPQLTITNAPSAPAPGPPN